MRRVKLQFLLAVALTIGAIIALTMSVKAGNLHIEHPYAPISIGGGKIGAIYFTIVNETETPDRLISASTPAARKAEVHNHLMQDGVMKMRKVDGLEIPAGGHVALKQGGLHLMMFGLKSPLNEGDSFELQLQFDKAGQVTIQVPIKPLGYKPPE